MKITKLLTLVRAPMAAFQRLALIAATAFAFIATPTFSADALHPRSPMAKPARTHLDAHAHDSTQIHVKFRDELPVRLRDGKLSDGDGRALAPASALLERVAAGRAKWRRTHHLSEEQLTDLRERAQKNTGKVMPDLNTEFILEIPKGMNAGQLIDEFNRLESVELASPMPMPTVLPVSNYESNQGYLDVAPGGLDARYAWSQPGGTGTDVRIADVEYLWNLNHADLRATLIGPAPNPPSFNNQPTGADHGTAVLGEMGARADGLGVTGIAYDSTFFVAAANTASGYVPAAAITTAAASLRAGDILIIEQQTDGPAANDDLVPLEWIASVYNAIVTAVGAGIVVVEAAGNGNADLDDPIYNVGHAPFIPANDSGAIIVGAGAPPGAIEGDRARLGFSSFGSTVDVQGIGQSVWTTGYGNAFSSEGTNRFYTSSFSGTSSATPMVAAACAAIQGAYKARFGGRVLAPQEIRAILRATGSVQTGVNAATQNIGPRPNLDPAIRLAMAGGTWVDFAYTGPENGSFLHPFNTLAEGVAAVPPRGTVWIKSGIAGSSGLSLPNLSGVPTKSFSLQCASGTATLGRNY